MEKEQLILNIEQAISALNFTSAETLASEALKAYPEETFGYRYLAEALIKREHIPYQALEMCYIKLIQLNAHDTESILKYAELKILQGDLEEAIKAYKNVLTHDISNVKALKALGEYELYANNFPEQALVYFDAAMANAPLDADLKCHRAVALKNSGRLLDALMELNSVIKKGFHELAYSTKVLMYNEMQKIEDTIPMLTELTQNKPDNFAYFYLLGKNTAQLHKWEMSLNALSRAIQLNEEPDAALLALYADVLLHNSKAAEALEAIQKAIQLEPEVVSYRLFEVSALRACGKIDLASAAVEKLLASSDDVYRHDILIEKAYLLAASGKLSEAEELLLKIRKEPGGSNPASYALGYLAYHFEKSPEKAFFYMHAAAVAGNADAKAFIANKLSDYLKAKHDELLKNNSSHISENAANPMLKSLFGKVWQFENFKSEKLGTPSEEISSKIKGQLIKRGVFFTDQVILINNAVELQICTYKVIRQHNETALDIEVIPLNGLTRTVVRLINSDKGLIYSQEAGEFILYKTVAAENIDPALKEAIQGNYKAGSLDFMGEKANAFIQAI